MYINNILINVDREYQTKTQLGLEYFQTELGNYYVTDYSSNSDIYNLSITTFGTESYINNILTNIDDWSVTVSGCLCNYFGEDIDHSGTLSCNILSISPRETHSWKVFKLDIDIRLNNPTFKSLTTFDWSDPGCVGHEHTSDRIKKIITLDTYNGSITQYDPNQDEGICKFILNLSNANIGRLRQYYRVNRGSSFTLPNNCLGITYPFGPNSGGGDKTVKLLSLSESHLGPLRGLVTVELVEIIRLI